MVRRNMNVAMQYHEFVISWIIMRSAWGTDGVPQRTNLVLNGARQAVGLHLCPDLRHIVPEHDDIVLLAVNVPYMVAQQRFGLEPEAFEQRDRPLLIDGHLHRKFLEIGA